MDDRQIFVEYWNRTPDELMAALGSTPRGLRSDRALELLESVGHNSLEVKKRIRGLWLFLNQFKNPLVLILIFATLVSLLTKDWADALIILAIVLSSAVLTFVQEYNAGVAVEKLRARVRVKTLVLRDEVEREIPAEEVVPGDVVRLSAGSLVPADGILLEAKDFYINQAILTGETFAVEKRPGRVVVEAPLAQRTNCVFMGTNVRSGSALALIVQTGSHTAFGQVAKRLTIRPPETEFEMGVRRFGNLLSRMMLVLVVIVFAVNVSFQKPVLDSLLFSVALAVGITPEFLPAIISVTLSKGSQEMAKQGVIVRRLNAIENLGSMDVLCTDKTDTLTQGIVKLNDAIDVQGQPSRAVLHYAHINASLQTGLSDPLDEAIIAVRKTELDGVKKSTRSLTISCAKGLVWSSKRKVYGG
jgi:Mg2+-importing ATPase